LVGDALSIDLLLRHGASVNAKDAAQLTPLHWAAVKGSRTCITRLVEAGAELDEKEGNGKTPADMARELKAEGPWKDGLLDAGLTETGHRRKRYLAKVG
jgi:ankyrin repeat protein